MSILLNKSRVARFTSSQIYRLMGSPAVRKTYIEEKRREKRLGRPINIEKHAQAMSWGHFAERRVHNLLGTDYVSCGKETIIHPNPELAKWWSGSPDQKNARKQKGGEVKCFEPKAFSECVDAFYTDDLSVIKKECPAEYWQGVSNAILLGYKKFEWIFYIPYESELIELGEAAANWDGEDQFRYRFIFEAVTQGRYFELPFIPDKGYYRNLNVFEREVPESDTMDLTKAVMMAGLELDRA